MATIVRVDVSTGKERVLVNKVSIQQAEREKEYFIKHLYDTNQYDNYIIKIIP